MAIDDEKARKVRAICLRERIGDVTKPPAQGEALSAGHAPGPPKSPRALIQDKMHQLDEEERQRTGPPDPD